MLKDKAQCSYNIIVRQNQIELRALSASTSCWGELILTDKFRISSKNHKKKVTIYIYQKNIK